MSKMHCTTTVNVTELVRVRVVCKRDNCGAVFELPVDKLDCAFPDIICPACKVSFKRNPEDKEDFFNMLAKTVAGLRSLDKRFGIEFVIPENTID